MEERTEYGVIREHVPGRPAFWDGWYEDKNFAHQIADLRRKDEPGTWFYVVTRAGWKLMRRVRPR